MKAIEDGTVVESEVQHLGDDDLLPPSGEVTVSIDRFASQRDALLAHGGVGIRVKSTETAEDARPWLADVSRVALEFPSFTDGRAYSTARLLREKYGFAGELRAVGDVLRDQIFFMQRCGFDVFEVREDKDATEALHGFHEFSVTYQSAADGRLPVYRVRR